MNSFGKEQLMKYGWTIGKGLGAEEDGMTDAIKPKLKFCPTGLGHNIAEEFTFHWWDHVYNKASQNLKVKKKQNGHIKIVKQKDFTISTKKPSKFKIQNGTGLYDYFVKGNILNAAEETHENDSDSDSEDDDDDRKDFSSKLTDDQLFQICGGMTAHKGARHGLKMSAKLARLEQQEKGEQFNSFHHSPEISDELPSILFCTEKQEKSLQFDIPPGSPKVMSNLKPILKESTPDNNNLKKRKSVQFNEDLKLKIFSYCAQNCDKEADISIKMEDDETPSSTLAVYVEEFSIENNISTDAVYSGVKKKKKKVKKNVLHTGEDFWELLGRSLQQETNNINNILVDPKSNAMTLEADNLESVEQKENNENFEKKKKKKKKKSYDNVSNEQIVDNKNPQPTETEVLDITKSKKKKKRKTEVIYCEKDAEVCDLYDNSSAQTILPSELMKKKKKKKEIKLACSNDTLDISTNSNIVNLDGLFCSKDNVEGKLKKQSTVENAVEQMNWEEITSEKKKKRKRKLEDDDVTLGLTNTQSFSPKKKKYFKKGS